MFCFVYVPLSWNNRFLFCNLYRTSPISNFITVFTNSWNLVIHLYFVCQHFSLFVCFSATQQITTGMKNLPSCGYTAVIWTSNAVLWTCSLSTMEWIFIWIITTIIISITKPIRLNANICLFTLKVIGRTFCVLRTSFVCFIRGNIIFAIIYSITNLREIYLPE